MMAPCFVAQRTSRRPQMQIEVPKGRFSRPTHENMWCEVRKREAMVNDIAVRREESSRTRVRFFFSVIPHECDAMVVSSEGATQRRRWRRFCCRCHDPSTKAMPA